MNTILDALNEEQKLPALTTEGPVLVTAGAGSGKTRLLTHRIAYLVRDKFISPFNILAITFTNKATNEMRERLNKMIDGAENMWILTFHSMCTRILRMYGDRLGFGKNFTIYGDSEKERVIKRLFVGEKTAKDINMVSFHISNAKNKLMDANEYYKLIKHEKQSELISDLYQKYQNELKLSNAMDFDDLIFNCYLLFQNYPDVLEYFQDRFKYILVDEFQDTNYAQYKLVYMLGEKYKNVFAVGDEDQCIYSWRGAEFSNIQKFQSDFSGIKVFKLEQNYRSKKNILDKANLIISNNTNRLDKKLWTQNDVGDKVEYYVGYNDLEEAEWVASKIKTLIATKNYKYSDFCVLMRVNALSRVIEEKFLNYQIPHQVYGGFKFFERKEIKDVLSYLKIISNPSDNDSFIRVLQFPKKGIGDATIAKIQEVSNMTSKSMFDVIKNNLISDANIIKKCNSTISMIEYFKDKINQGVGLFDITKEIVSFNKIKEAIGNSTEEETSKNLNIDNLINSTFEFENNNEGATIDDYLQSVTLSRDIDELDDKNNFVSIMTIHSAKGLEFKVVFIIGCSEGLLPLSRAIYSGDQNELEEERRLMYVATTRAEEKLYYTRPSTRFVFETKRTELTMPSRFLKEAGIEEKKPENNKAIRPSERQFEYSSKNYNVKRVSFFEDDDDNDNNVRVEKISATTANKYSSFKKGTKVIHPSFGEGEVIVEVTDPVGAFVTIRFEKVGIKTLSLKFAPLKII